MQREIRGERSGGDWRKREKREIGGERDYLCWGDGESPFGDDASENRYDGYPSEVGLFLLLSIGGMSSSRRRRGHDDNVAERTSKRAILGDFFFALDRENMRL